MERLRVEAQRSNQLAHPNIVRIYDFLSGQHGVAVAMEFVEGWSLWSLKVDKPGQRFSVDEIAPWIGDLCAALDHAHAAEIVHRDVKPSNLIMDARGQLKLADFGLARSMNPAGLEASPNYSQAVILNAPKVILSGGQMAFRAEPARPRNSSSLIWRWAWCSGTAWAISKAGFTPAPRRDYGIWSG